MARTTAPSARCRSAPRLVTIIGSVVGEPVCNRGDTVIVIAYQHLSDEEAQRAEPRKVFVDADNGVNSIEIGDGNSHNPRETVRAL